MIQSNQMLETKYPIDNIFQEIAKYVQNDDHLKRMFINLGQELTRGITEPDRSLTAIETEVPVPKYSIEQIEQMIVDLLVIVSNQFELSDKATLSTIGDEFRRKHCSWHWDDMGFRSLSCALEIHLPECYMLSPCRKFVTKSADLSELDIGNAIVSTAEVKPLKQYHAKTISSNKKQRSSKTKQPKEFSTEVIKVHTLLSSMKRITFAGQGPRGDERPKQYKIAFDVEVSWVKSRKKSSHKDFVERVLATKPELIVQSKRGIGKQESRLLKLNCKKYSIPYVIVTSLSGVDTVAHNIMKQVSDQLAKGNK